MADEGVSRSAILVAAARRLLGQTYAGEIEALLLARDGTLSRPDEGFTRKFARMVARRTTMIDNLIETANIADIVDLGAGDSPRGLVRADRGYRYTEIDLAGITAVKREIVASIVAEHGLNCDSLAIETANALFPLQVEEVVDAHHSTGNPVILIVEGVWPWFDPSNGELDKLVETITTVLRKRPGSRAIVTNVLFASEVRPNHFDEWMAQFTGRNAVEYATSDSGFREHFPDLEVTELEGEDDGKYPSLRLAHCYLIAS